MPVHTTVFTSTVEILNRYMEKQNYVTKS